MNKTTLLIEQVVLSRASPNKLFYKVLINQIIKKNNRIMCIIFIFYFKYIKEISKDLCGRVSTSGSQTRVQGCWVGFN